MWWGLFLLAAGHWSGLVFVLSPVLMTWTLAKGTGAPLTEKRMSSSRRGYADYVRRTSGFVPRPTEEGLTNDERPRSEVRCGALGQAAAQAVGSSTSMLRVRFGSTGMPGPIVVETVTFFRYRPLADDGLARRTSSSAAA